MSVLRPGKFFVSCAFTTNTRIPRSARMSYSAIQYTPVDCMATVSIPHRTSQSAISCRVLRETSEAPHRLRVQIRRHRHPVLLITYIDTRGFGGHYLQPQRAILPLQLRSVVLPC